MFTRLETETSRRHECGDAASSRLAGNVYFAVQFSELPGEWGTSSRCWNNRENVPQELPVLFLASLLFFFFISFKRPLCIFMKYSVWDCIRSQAHHDFKKKWQLILSYTHVCSCWSFKTVSWFDFLIFLVVSEKSMFFCTADTNTFLPPPHQCH